MHSFLLRLMKINAPWNLMSRNYYILSCYMSCIQITHPDIIDTGYYYCFYNGAGNLATDVVKATSTYVYVHGKAY